jgi:short-subunit dehydrogenase
MARRSIGDCRVIVTGASSGIGRELALALARRRARVLVSGRREELLRSLVAECQRLGGDGYFLAGDVTDAAYRQALVGRASERWGGIDVLVNNAGVSAHGQFAISTEATLRQIMEVNFFAAVELTRQVLPLLQNRQQRAGASPPPAIVNIGSILGHRAAPLNSEYAASKFALRGWSESLRAELAGHGIDVLLVSPGTTETEFFDHLIAKHDDLPWGKAKGIPAAAVAEQIVRALELGRREIFPNWRGRALVLANRFFPGLIDRAMVKLGRRTP